MKLLAMLIVLILAVVVLIGLAAIKVSGDISEREEQRDFNKLKREIERNRIKDS